MTTSKIILTRFKGYFQQYVQSVGRLSEEAKQQKLTARNNSAIASKTMTSRKALHGDKGTTGAGIQSIRQAGKDRTNSKKA